MGERARPCLYPFSVCLGRWSPAEKPRTDSAVSGHTHTDGRTDERCVIEVRMRKAHFIGLLEIEPIVQTDYMSSLSEIRHGFATPWSMDACIDATMDAANSGGGAFTPARTPNLRVCVMPTNKQHYWLGASKMCRARAAYFPMMPSCVDLARHPNLLEQLPLARAPAEDLLKSHSSTTGIFAVVLK